MASKLSKDDYQKALSAEYGFPVFLTDAEYERLSTKKPLSKPAQAYQDPFAYVDENKAAKAAAEKERKSKPESWTTAPGLTYNRMHGKSSLADRKADAAPIASARYAGFEDGSSKPFLSATAPAKAAPPVLQGVPKPTAPGSPIIGKIEKPETPKVTPAGPALTADTSFQLGANIVPEHINPEADVEDLGNDPGGTSMDEKIAAQQQYEMLKAADAIGDLPKTYKLGYAPPAAKPAPLPTFMSPQEENDAMLKKYAMLGGTK